MNICLVSKTVDPRSGGLGRHVSELADSLSEKGHSVTVLTRKDSSVPEIDADVEQIKFVDLHQDVLNSYTALPGIVNYFRKNSDRFDIIHGHGLIGFSAILARYLGMADCKFVYTLHGVSAEHTSRAWLKPAADLLFYPEKITVKKSKGLIAVSNDTKQKAMDHYGLEGGDLEVIHNGVDMERFKGSWVFGDKVLFVGHMVSRKGPLNLIKAFKKISTDFPELELIYVGSGRQKEELVDLSAHKGLQDRVKFKEGISDEELSDLYRQSIFCMPSSYEGFGMVYIEAMASGSPVLATKGTAIEEVIDHRENGLLTERDPGSLSESLREVLNNEELREELSKNAKETAEEFDWSNIAEQTLDYYQDIMDS